MPTGNVSYEQQETDYSCVLYCLGSNVDTQLTKTLTLTVTVHQIVSEGPNMQSATSSQKPFRDFLIKRGPAGSIGIQFRRKPNASDLANGGPCELVALASNGPARVAGLEAGDLIYGVDRQSVIGKSVAEVSELIRGEAGTYVQISAISTPSLMPGTLLAKEKISSDRVTLKGALQTPTLPSLQTKRSFGADETTTAFYSNSRYWDPAQDDDEEERLLEQRLQKLRQRKTEKLLQGNTSPPEGAKGNDDIIDQFHVHLIRAPKGGVGIGFIKAGNDSGPFIIWQVAPTGPAKASGQVHDGDLLHAVNGVSVHDATPADVTKLIVGQPGTSLRLTLSRPTQQELAYVQYASYQGAKHAASAQDMSHERAPAQFVHEPLTAYLERLNPRYDPLPSLQGQRRTGIQYQYLYPENRQSQANAGYAGALKTVPYFDPRWVDPQPAFDAMTKLSTEIQRPFQN